MDTNQALAVVGRAETVDIRLTDVAVSQFHVELRATRCGVEVRDLESRNGVGYLGAQVRNVTVPNGGLLCLGCSTIRVETVSSSLPQPVKKRQFGHLVGDSERMQEIFPLLARLAATDISVLIEGATGTGKGEVARALHEDSKRAAAPFVVVDCTLLPDTLAPSLLFGHERGAFTGAVDKRIGAFESANGGVLFLDEAAELSPAVQAMLLRAVQYREITPVGSNKKRALDLRIISATWRDLRAMVNEGTFREDLYYRLAGASVRLPSLAQRLEDIPLLVQQFLHGLPSKAFAARAIAPDALTALSRRHYPGNVRELLMLVERLAHLAAGPTITPADLEMEQVLSGLRERTAAPTSRTAPRSSSAVAGAGTNLPLYLEAKQTALDEFERRYLLILLERARGNLSRAAALAGIQRKNLRTLLRKHSLYRSPEDNTQ